MIYDNLKPCAIQESVSRGTLQNNDHASLSTGWDASRNCYVRNWWLCVRFPLLLFLGICSSLSAQTIHDYVDLTMLSKHGERWETIDSTLSTTCGHITLHHSEWLMYFLHWRPLTKENSNLTKAYVRNHLLNFWGAAMDFELTNADGETEVCGHKALFTEGNFGKGAVYTRFIVWNCPETNRQFTADCNINLRRRTPKELLELQYLITQTVCCHKGGKSVTSSKLTKRYESREFGVSFSIPPDWKTATYEDTTWFPRGPNKQNGSLWTLPTNSVKHVELLWDADDDELSAASMTRRLQKMTGGPWKLCDTIFVSNIALRMSSTKETSLLGEGSYDLSVKLKDTLLVFPFMFKALLWKRGNRTFLLLGSMFEVKEFWNRKDDLTPSEQTMNTFLIDEVLPAVKIPRGS
jgi:hypothetical protein